MMIDNRCLTVYLIIPPSSNSILKSITFEECSVNSCDSLSSAYDHEMASLLLLVHLLPPPPGGPKSSKISACDAAERLVVFHKVNKLLW